ncbi:MAG: sigma-70 family RNA polymerase sigma factor [Fimbriimonadaceae bacterium]|nr:sigma-70 family RNA polymerase sigma factor [Fimbriimonadaceae bacterium]QYK58331.1 MAG: sigma-70 family RNA polymerase sigma factor [Fimbriimonadaceae bacterium]
MTGDAFERLANRHKDAVCRHMVRVCHHKVDAEDALTSALLKAFRARERLAYEEFLQTWLAAMARLVCSRMRSHPAMQPVLELAEKHGPVDRDRSEFEISMIKGCVAEVVENLPQIYQDIDFACELNELTVVEAAQSLKVSHSAAKSRLLRARAMIRDEFDRSVCAA